MGVSAEGGGTWEASARIWCEVVVGLMRVEAVRPCEGVRFWVYAYFSHRANHTRCSGETKREVQKDCKVLGLSQWQDGVAVNLGKGSGRRCSLRGPIQELR